MTELRLRRNLYRGPAVDEAIAVYRAYATFERVEDDDYWAVRVVGASAERERRIAGELANFALGLTVGTREGGGSGARP